ncbi:MAG: hypothetical protein IJ461_10585 [Clostridia bacterium]|nr:hypothetical protein [Clostridia bacterium]
MLDLDKWITDALSTLEDEELTAMSREPMRKAQADEMWIVWREVSLRKVFASGEPVLIQHNLRLTLSYTEEQDHQTLTRMIQETLRGRRGCLYARYGGDQWNQEIKRRECVLYLGVLES